MSDELSDLLAEYLSGYNIEKKKMFGCPAYFINNMCYFIYVLTLSEEVYSNQQLFSNWLGKSYKFASSLPYKEPKSRKKKQTS